MSLRFGTDGVRGPADDFTPSFVAALGAAAAHVLGDTGAFVIGRDTRESGARIESLLAVGLAEGGCSAVSMGVVPTPAVAWVCARDGVPGAVISASHNPWTDNGIKFFGAGGRKLTDDQEAAIESELDRRLGDVATSTVDRPSIRMDESLVDDWCAAVIASVGSDGGPGDGSNEVRVDRGARPFDGLMILIDCANGASSSVAPRILTELGATVEVLHAAPDGRNINAACGSTHPEDLQHRVVELGARCGLAFDGDADRIVAVDELGRLVDGDCLIAMFATDLRSRGALRGDRVVVTVMTNLGFRIAMGERAIEVIDTPVGDRHVIEAIERTGASLGGEQSGHLVFADLATTGDGVLAGVQLLDLLIRSDRPLSELADASMTRLPQVLVNVAVERRRADIAAAIAADIAAAEIELGIGGRVLIRPSGTEPLVRVMVEAPTIEEADAVAESLAAAVAAACRA